MTLAGRHLVSINDFTNEEVEAVLDLAEEMNSCLDRRERLRLGDGRELYTLFYEPSTRTRSSFETAMHRLGGTVVSHAEAQVTSSVAKGETIADTVRVLEKYADIIVMRHHLDGSTRLAAEHSSVPVISGGDGAHEHPTQTLLDLYTIKRERGGIEGKSVAVCGDLRHGRTVHSLVVALSRFGVDITCIAPAEFDLPDHVRDALAAAGSRITEYKSLDEISPEVMDSLEVLYFTRLQRERFDTQESSVAGEESYRINKQLLARSREDAVIMHPLPRVNELAYEVDRDKRAAYFRQAGYGVPVRMALIALLLGVAGSPDCSGKNAPEMIPDEKPEMKCLNDRCVTNAEQYVTRLFHPVAGKSGVFRCHYCDWMVQS